MVEKIDSSYFEFNKEYVKHISNIFKRAGLEIDGIVPVSLAERNLVLDANELTDNVILATRNLNNVVLLEASEINTYDVIAADNMIVTEKAVNAIEEVLV